MSGETEDKVFEVAAALRSMVQHFQPSFTASSHSVIVAPSVFGSHIENFSISVNTKEEQSHNKKNEDEEKPDARFESPSIEDCRRNLKASFRKKFGCLLEGTTNQCSKVSLNSIFTDLYITEGGGGGVSQEHEVRQMEALAKSRMTDEKSIHCSTLFQPKPGQEHPVRTVLTRGIAGIGKTVAINKFTLDWAEDKANTHFDFVFTLCLRELNLMKDKRLSFEELLGKFFPEIRNFRRGILSNGRWKTLIILDGLDESRIDLDFQNCEIMSDADETSNLGVILVNLIRGRLLPVCPVWITSRPAASSQIPGELVDLVTEIRGFNNLQKDEYFRRKIPNRNIAGKIITHIKSCRSLYIMCYIPLFCWMATKVLGNKNNNDLPKTLTQMYIHFLALFICDIKQRLQRSQDDIFDSVRANLLALGRLAFKGLEKGNLVFYQRDLRLLGIDGDQESMFSGIYTEIFNEETAICGEKMFCFVHLSVQEFFAALYVFLTFHNENTNVLVKKSSATRRLLQRDSSEIILYKEAIAKALQCPGGQYDMFLRFLLGLSQEANRSFIKQRLMTKNRGNAKTRGEIIKHLKEKIKMGPPPGRCFNLFHCLNELNDRSLVEEIQSFIKAGSVGRSSLTPSQWASLVFVLLTSEEELKEFNLGNYARSEEALHRMLPVVREAQIVNLRACALTKTSCQTLSPLLSSSQIQQLDLSLNPITDAGLRKLCAGLQDSLVHTLRLKGCGLTELSAEPLSSLLSSAQCKLRSLDVSDNDFGDEGVQRLSEGLSSPHCGLETLSLALCRVTERGCTFLASALNGSVLRELDLSYNHPGPAGLQLLSAVRDDPLCSLSKLSVEECGKARIEPGPKKYQDRRAARGLKPVVPDSKDRFLFWVQVLSTKGLRGRWYWEAECDGRVCVGVAYADMSRTGQGAESRLGQNRSSWGLNCNKDGFKAVHDGVVTALPAPRTSNTVGVFLDWWAGRLSFFSVGEAETCHIFTFNANFTDPVYPAFHLSWIGSSIRLC